MALIIIKINEANPKYWRKTGRYPYPIPAFISSDWCPDIATIKAGTRIRNNEKVINDLDLYLLIFSSLVFNVDNKKTTKPVSTAETIKSKKLILRKERLLKPSARFQVKGKVEISWI